MHIKKNAQHHHSLGECKLKAQSDTIIYPLEYLKFKRPTISRDSKYVEQLELTYTSCRNVEWYNQFGKRIDSFLHI